MYFQHISLDNFRKTFSSKTSKYLSDTDTHTGLAITIDESGTYWTWTYVKNETIVSANIDVNERRAVAILVLFFGIAIYENTIYQFDFNTYRIMDNY